ncbi:MAG TPA: nucleotidyltransferase family protein [Candidatus Woesebacteria bacterium]|nr:nucleotidyltransferase family protein [Candidatus Woesebacteria bacterium]
MNIQNITNKTSHILSSYGVRKAALFGSYARNQQNLKSDIDILVELGDKELSLLDFIGLKLDLEDSLGKKVDVVQYKTLKPSLRSYILKDEHIFYQV